MNKIILGCIVILTSIISTSASAAADNVNCYQECPMSERYMHCEHKNGSASSTCQSILNECEKVCGELQAN